MFVTNGLAQFAHHIAMRSVRESVEQKRHDIREALMEVEGEDDDDVRKSVADELVQEYQSVSNPVWIKGEVNRRRNDLVGRVQGTKVEVPTAPQPPAPMNGWSLTVVPNDRKNFDDHMEKLAHDSFYVASLQEPGSEFVKPENLKDPYWLGLWRLDRQRYPNACCWAETDANFRADRERVAKGWPTTPTDHATQCYKACITACAIGLGISESEMETNLPSDLRAYWETHANGE